MRYGGSTTLFAKNWSPLAPIAAVQLPLLNKLDHLAIKSAKWLANDKSWDFLSHQEDVLLEAEVLSFQNTLRNFFPSHQLNYLHCCREKFNQQLSKRASLQQKFTGWMQTATLVCLMLVVFALGHAYDRKTEADTAVSQRLTAEKSAILATKNLSNAVDEKEKAELQKMEADLNSATVTRHLQQTTLNLAQSLLQTVGSQALHKTPQLSANICWKQPIFLSGRTPEKS